ncbi:MAG: LysM domain-containing protein [Lactobacillus helveticus]|uniref:SAG1386/EF1546 family surface-associated protein n=1 Tax=Lactobacillus helveticus TaxID=1587 RepID=UPI000D7C38F6|nr:SAG1386/EF1546 family surface-associated protein [Lactobacillus helveticus]AZA19973.1 MAG: LysM domain-containing protein [Lactobacillus helveticus]PXZ27518.1 LysM domain-containing protein [Lactobacillus helveticus]
MDKKSTGPYQHYERPTEKRSSQDKQPGGSARWIAVIVILVVALIPVVHRLSSGNSEKAEEVQTVKKVSSKKSSKAIKSSNKAKKTSSSAKKNSVKTSSSSSQESKPKTYLVKDGDTLTNIAEKNGMTVDQLSRLNDLEDTSNVNVGQTLKLR